MPKMKTKRAAAKRFRVTGSGKIKHSRTGRRHLLQHKSRKTKRGLTGDVLAHGSEVRQMKRLLGIKAPAAPRD